MVDRNHSLAIVTSYPPVKICVVMFDGGDPAEKADHPDFVFPVKLKFQSGQYCVVVV